MNRAKAKVRIEQLSVQIDYHNDLYYQQNKSEIPDIEFDKLLEELVKLENEFPDLKDPNSPTQRVGGSITKQFETVTHKYPMLSLGNTYSRDELMEFDKRVQKGLDGQHYEYFCELKFDGVAISMSYNNGQLTRAVTRGDGTRGDDVSNNIKTIRSIPLKIVKSSFPSEFEVRGEVFLSKQSFSRLNEKREDIGAELYANARNTASGTLKMLDSTEVANRKLDCFFYSLLGSDLKIESHESAINSIIKMGFKVSPTFRKCASIEEVLSYIDEWEMKRHELQVETDGIVIKVNDIQQQQHLGFTAKNPRWAISYKYKAESAITQLMKITYQVGRTGAITPVAELKPALLAGTTVKRASLHNANEIERLDLRIGDTVKIEKGGEIIPKVVSVLPENRLPESMPVTFISNCPECDTKLTRKEGEANHYCPNAEGCPPQILGRIEHFIQRKAMNIDSLGPETIRGLLQAGKIRNISDLYSLKFEDLNGLEFKVSKDGVEKIRSLREKSAKNIINAILQSKGQPFEQVMFALGIRYVGATVAEKLAQHFENIQNIQNATFDQLIETNDIGEQIAQSVINFFSDPDNLEIIEKLKNAGLQFQIEKINTNLESDIFDGATFVVSGVFNNYNRDSLKDAIRQNGGKVISALSGKLNYLLIGKDPGPSKLAKAEKLGLKIITEDEFQRLIS